MFVAKWDANRQRYEWGAAYREMRTIGFGRRYVERRSPSSATLEAMSAGYRGEKCGMRGVRD
jgi:hypothetical protein